MNSKQIDQDGCILPGYIPLDLWNRYVQIARENKVRITYTRKAAWVLSLSRFHRRQKDLRPIMQRSIDNRWYGFYD